MARLYDPVSLGLEIFRIADREVLVRCPYHDDEHPSAYFNTKHGVFYCFSCGTSKNAVQIARDFDTEVKRVPYVEAEDADIVFNVIDWSTFLRAPMAFANPYLESRGVADATVASFDIRQLPGAIAFLIKNFERQVVGVQLRMTEAKAGPKYLLFGERTALWPLDGYVERFKPDDKNMFVVEGVFGVLNAWQNGIDAYAVMGASSIAEASLYLKGKDSFKILFDDDFAGYVGAASLCLRSFLHGAVILPGAEADEMTDDEWAAARLDKGSVDFARMAELSGDRERFNRLVWKRGLL